MKNGCVDFMDARFQPIATPQQTPVQPDGDRDGRAELNLCPVLFSGYRELTGLRYDFPLVLVDGDGGGAYVKSLSSIVNGILREIAPAGMAGERLRKHMLRLEKEVRTLVSGGAAGSLSDIWTVAEANLLAGVDDAGRENLRETFALARGVPGCDGAVIDCDEETAIRLVTRAWTTVEQEKTRKFRAVIDRLVFRLSDILKADFMKSDEARDPELLRRSMGTAFEAEFDFQEMSRVLSSAATANPLPENRRERIRAVLSVLRSQRFFAPPGARAAGAGTKGVHSFAFARCAKALKAFQDRLPEMARLMKAVSIAELEIENRYREAKHDRYFESFDENSLRLEDLASFPSYLVHLRGRKPGAAEQDCLFRILSSDLPIKVLHQTDDILDDLSAAAVQFSSGGRTALIAGMAVGLNSAYVLQSGTANLYGLRDRIVAGLAFHGPALFNVYTGSTTNVPGLPAYIVSAAATDSRAFPILIYDPAAGPDWASRFRVDDNPQPHAAWPVLRLGFEDDELQTVASDIAFTFVDFAACDDRMARYLTRVPRAAWHDGMVPIGEYLELDAGARSGKAPYILMIDEHDRLHRVVVDGKLIDAARHFGDRWRSLQELGGIDNSHAAKLLARERELWEAEKRQLQDAAADLPPPADRAPPSDTVPEQAAPAPAEAAPEIEEEVPEGPVEDPFIDTPRCTTCNECTDLNNRMFAYNDNMQAYIADPDAGSFKEMVEAAELCQVCIIHPGQPRNPDEADLAELIERAEPFN